MIFRTCWQAASTRMDALYYLGRIADIREEYDRAIRCIARFA